MIRVTKSVRLNLGYILYPHSFFFGNSAQLIEKNDNITPNYHKRYANTLYHLFGTLVSLSSINQSIHQFTLTKRHRHHCTQIITKSALMSQNYDDKAQMSQKYDDRGTNVPKIGRRVFAYRSQQFGVYLSFFPS